MFGRVAGVNPAGDQRAAPAPSFRRGQGENINKTGRRLRKIQISINKTKKLLDKIQIRHKIN
jgi:hypothetical protein